MKNLDQYSHFKSENDKIIRWINSQVKNQDISHHLKEWAAALQSYVVKAVALTDETEAAPANLSTTESAGQKNWKAHSMNKRL